MSSQLAASGFILFVKILAGFAIAAFIAWKLTVIRAINIAATPAMINAAQPICIRYAKSCSHLCIPSHANGTAITIEINTRMIKSFVRSETISGTEAPNTFLTPISFTLCCAAYVINPHKPRQDISMANAEKILKRLYNLTSDLYNASNC